MALMFLPYFISLVIRMRSCGCPITGIQFELFVIGTRNWTTTWFMCQLHVLSWLPPHCFLQFSKLMKKQTSSQGMMLFMSINWPIVLKAHICQSDGGMSCDNSPNHIKESYLSASIKHWSHSRSFPLAFTITASTSLLGDNIFPLPPLSYRYLSVWHYAMYFRLPAVGHLFLPHLCWKW